MTSLSFGALLDELMSAGRGMIGDECGALRVSAVRDHLLRRRHSSKRILVYTWVYLFLLRMIGVSRTISMSQRRSKHSQLASAAHRQQYDTYPQVFVDFMS